jgi:hypothetical protein
MPDGGLRQIDHAVDVGAKGVIPLLVPNLFEARLRHLVGSIVDKDIYLAEVVDGSVKAIATARPIPE